MTSENYDCIDNGGHEWDFNQKTLLEGGIVEMEFFCVYCGITRQEYREEN